MSMAKADAAQNCACSGYSLRIADETRSVHSYPATADVDDVADPSFREFVKTVSDHVLTTACGGRALPQPTNSADADVQLLFIKRPLVKQAGAAAADPLAAEKHHAPDLRRLDSPWVKLAISREPLCRVGAVFVWNERQLLRDQASMAAGRAVGTGAPVAIDGAVLVQYSEEYAERVVLAPPEAGKAALTELASRMPPEILWLYRHAVQSTLYDFSVFAMEALEATVAKARWSYADIVTALFDRCFNSDLHQAARTASRGRFSFPAQAALTEASDCQCNSCWQPDSCKPCRPNRGHATPCAQ